MANTHDDPLPASGHDGTPRVSVVIPLYNYARYLPDCVGSVLAQTFQDFEIIIVNDGSTDNSLEVAQALAAAHPEACIRLIDQPNAGPSIARNNGIAAARGQEILCLDADDEIAPAMLAECVCLLDADPAVAIAYTDRQDFGGSDEIVCAGEYDFSSLRFVNHLSYCALYRKQVWAAVGGYRSNMRGNEDWDFWVAAGAHGHFGRRIPQPLFRYRRHETGLFQVALANFDRLRAQMVMNNREVYAGEEVRLAERQLAVGDRPEVRPDPLVSVLVATRDRPRSVMAAVRSALAQTMAEVEVIVVNDGGDDLSARFREIAADRTDPAGREILQITHPENLGAAAARNTAVRAARGKYLAFLDDDDRFYLEHLELLVQAVESSGCKVAYSDWYEVLRAHGTDDCKFAPSRLAQAASITKESLLVQRPPPLSCFLIERSCLLDSGLFDESLERNYDWDLLIRLSRRYAPFHLPVATCECCLRTDPAGKPLEPGAIFYLSFYTVLRRYAFHALADPVVKQYHDQSLRMLEERFPVARRWYELREQRLAALSERGRVASTVEGKKARTSGGLLGALRNPVAEPADTAGPLPETDRSRPGCAARVVLPDRRGFNILLLEPDPTDLVSHLEVYLTAFAESEDVALHVLCGDHTDTVQGIVLATIVRLGLEAESIPDVSLVSLHPEARPQIPLDTYLRSGDLVLGTVDVVEAARKLGIPAEAKPTADFLRSAAFPTSG